MVHYNDNALKYDLYVFVSYYLNHDQYAVVFILGERLNDFKLRHWSIQFENTTLQSDGTVQHFKQQYALSWMTTLKNPVAWEVSVTSHGKEDIDDIDRIYKRRVREKTKARLLFPGNYFEFSDVAAEICFNINVMHCSKGKIQSEEKRLHKSWDSISNIPGTRRFHFLKTTRENIIRLQTISVDPYN